MSCYDLALYSNSKFDRDILSSPTVGVGGFNFAFFNAELVHNRQIYRFTYLLYLPTSHLYRINVS